MKRTLTLLTFFAALLLGFGPVRAQIAPQVPYVAGSDVSPGALNQTIAQINQAFSAYGAPVSTKTIVFTSSGTYTPTAGAKVVQVTVIGGGGGGGGAHRPRRSSIRRDPRPVRL